MRATDPRAVLQALALRTVLPANWSSGLAEARDAGVFVAPPVDGWVLAVGADLTRVSLDPARIEALLALLGAAFGEACWFSTDDAGERHGWARAVRGTLQRGYAFDVEHGHVWWVGDVTDAERALRCFVDDPRDTSDDDVKWWPDRRTVLGIAAAWTLDPSRLSTKAASCGAGWIGRL